MRRRVTTTGSAEDNSRSQAGDGLSIDGVDIGKNGIFPRRDVLGQVDLLHDDGLALLYGALHLDFLDLVAEVDFHVDESDEAVLDLQYDVGAVFDVFVEYA